jgi:hypothetical protein
MVTNHKFYNNLKTKKMENQNQENQNNLKEVQNETAFQPLTEGEQAQVTGGQWIKSIEENIPTTDADAKKINEAHNCPPGHIWQSELNTCVDHEPIDPIPHPGVYTGVVR